MGTTAATATTTGAERYEVAGALGRGAFGEVRRGRRRSTGEPVAIKILEEEGQRGRVARNELRVLRALREAGAEERHVVRFLEAFGDGARVYVVFELLDRNLFEFQKERRFAPLPPRHIRTVAAQVLAALAKLEELSIIHADVKPENIMLVDHARQPFRVKLIDFGSASVAAEVRHLKEPYIQSRFYRAPEILLGLPFGEKMDVWSLGCVVAELHLGWPLYPGADEGEQVRYICSTLGPPRAELLRAARKAPAFFRWVPRPVGRWELRAGGGGGSGGAAPERRKHVFSSLDQLAAVNARAAAAGELRGMVELLKRMLTWDAGERITPGAALAHPFIRAAPRRRRDEAPRADRAAAERDAEAAAEEMDGLSLAGDAAAAARNRRRPKTQPGAGAPLEPRAPPAALLRQHPQRC